MFTISFICTFHLIFCLTIGNPACYFSCTDLGSIAGVRRSHRIGKTMWQAHFGVRRSWTNEVRPSLKFSYFLPNNEQINTDREGPFFSFFVLIHNNLGVLPTPPSTYTICVTSIVHLIAIEVKHENNIMVWKIIEDKFSIQSCQIAFHSICRLQNSKNWIKVQFLFWQTGFRSSFPLF